MGPPALGAVRPARGASAPFPWASSPDGDFNADFGVEFTEAQQRGEGIEYKYRREAPIRAPITGASVMPSETWQNWQRRGSASSPSPASPP